MSGISTNNILAIQIGKHQNYNFVQFVIFVKNKITISVFPKKMFSILSYRKQDDGTILDWTNHSENENTKNKVINVYKYFDYKYL